MSANSSQEFWFLTGSEQLYGKQALDRVARRSLPAGLEEELLGERLHGPLAPGMNP